MKLLHPETDTHGHERFVLHIGRDELKAIHRVVCEALQTLPRIPETTQVRSRLKGIRLDIERIIEVPKQFFAGIAEANAGQLVDLDTALTQPSPDSHGAMR